MIIDVGFDRGKPGHYRKATSSGAFEARRRPPARKASASSPSSTASEKRYCVAARSPAMACGLAGLWDIGDIVKLIEENGEEQVDANK